MDRLAMATTAAPTHAPMLNTSRTSPREKARSPDRNITASTARSTDVIAPPSPVWLWVLRGFRDVEQSRVVLRPGFGAKPRDQIGDVADFLQRQTLGSRQPPIAVRHPSRQTRLNETKLCRFLEPGLGLGDLADLPRQADFTEPDGARGGRLVKRGGGDGGGDRQIGGRLIHPQAAGDVEPDVGHVQ